MAFETERLRISVLKKNAADKVTSYLCRNRTFHKKWSQPHSDRYFSKSTQREYLKADLTEYKRGNIVPLWITLKDDPDTIIGRLSFFNIAYGGMMCCSLGYHQDEDHQGHGYMTEAIKASVELMFKELKMHRIEAFILPENERSLALIKRCGFKEEGIRYSYMNIDGDFRDHVVFYTLAEKK